MVRPYLYADRDVCANVGSPEVICAPCPNTAPDTCAVAFGICSVSPPLVFRTVGPACMQSVTTRSQSGRAGHFCLPLHVSMQIGPYLRLGEAPRTWSLNLPVGADPGGLGC